MVTFDETEPSGPVDPSEVELARLADKLASVRQHVAYFPSSQPLIAFTLYVEAQQVAAFQHAFTLIRHKLRKILGRVVYGVPAQVLGDMVHDVGSGAELSKNLPVPLAAVERHLVQSGADEARLCVLRDTPSSLRKLSSRASAGCKDMRCRRRTAQRCADLREVVAASHSAQLDRRRGRLVPLPVWVSASGSWHAQMVIVAFGNVLRWQHLARQYCAAGKRVFAYEQGSVPTRPQTHKEAPRHGDASGPGCPWTMSPPPAPAAPRRCAGIHPHDRRVRPAQRPSRPVRATHRRGYRLLTHGPGSPSEREAFPAGIRAQRLALTCAVKAFQVPRRRSAGDRPGACCPGPPRPARRCRPRRRLRVLRCSCFCATRCRSPPLFLGHFPDQVAGRPHDSASARVDRTRERHGRPRRGCR